MLEPRGFGPTFDGVKMDTVFLQVQTLEEAKEAAPWAARIVKVEGGYVAFRYVTDEKIWKDQK